MANADVTPHLEFVDMAGHGYAVVCAGPDAIETEFVCIARPIARAATPDGGPLRYRVSHRAHMWQPGVRPRLEQRILEGDAKLSIRGPAGSTPTAHPISAGN
jgi:alkaline phosphatase D